MTKEEINEKYNIALNERINLEKEIGKMVDDWVNGDPTLNVIIVEDLLDKGYQRLDELKAIEQELLSLYNEQDESNNIKR